MSDQKEESKVETPPPPRTPGRGDSGSHTVEVPVSTLVHLMGLATSSEIKTLEAKLDLLLSRVTATSLKVERITTQLAALTAELSLERVELQLTDIRAVMKKVFPQIAGSDFQELAKGKGKGSPRGSD